ncbi:hypothetical protein MRX96_028467 [Rhipicephalus microplus]
MRQLGVNILNAIEISAQEAAWFLLRFDMCTTSRDIMYVNTHWTEERHWSRKTKAELEEQGVLPTSCDIWHKTPLEWYEHRPVEMEGVTFAEFMVKYNRSSLRKRQKPAVLSNNDVDVHNRMVAESCEYKHDSVATHVVTGHRSRQEEREALARIQDLSRAESGNLPSVVMFCTKRPYMLLKNFDVTDGLVNGMVEVGVATRSQAVTIPEFGMVAYASRINATRSSGVCIYARNGIGASELPNVAVPKGEPRAFSLTKVV